MPHYVLADEWETTIAAWLVWLQLGGASKHTLRQRRGCVRMVARRSKTRRPRELTLAHIVAIGQAQDWSREHRRGVRASLISFYDWCIDNDVCPHNPANGLPKVAPERPRPRPCPDDIWRELLAAAAPREQLMARLAGELGMRRAEVAIASGHDLIRDVGGWAMIVHGKGGKQRVVAVPDALAEAIRRYAGGDGGHLFPGQEDGHISAQRVGDVISELMPDGWTMHKLRHRYATLGYAGTGDIVAVKEALGHASVATTQIYTAVAPNGVRAVSEAAARTPLHSPHEADRGGGAAGRRCRCGGGLRLDRHTHADA